MPTRLISILVHLNDFARQTLHAFSSLCSSDSLPNLQLLQDAVEASSAVLRVRPQEVLHAPVRGCWLDTEDHHFVGHATEQVTGDHHVSEA
jgi:hypothetical protein